MGHIPSGFSMTTISSFKSIENKYAVNRGKDCMKKFCQSLRKHTVKIIIFTKKKNKIINKRTAATYENEKICCICKGKYENKHVKDKKYCKVSTYISLPVYEEYRGAVWFLGCVIYNKCT